MVHIGRFITDMIILVCVVVFYLRIVDVSAVPFLNILTLPFYDSLIQRILIVALGVFFAIDSLIFGPPPIFNTVIVFGASTLILANYGLGIIFAIITFVLLGSISRIFRRAEVLKKK